MKITFTAGCLLAFLVVCGASAQTCPTGLRVEGVVVDPNGLRVGRARIVADGGVSVKSDAVGHFVFPCLARSTDPVHLTVEAKGFAQATVLVDTVSDARVAVPLTIHMAVQRVETNLVVGENGTVSSTDYAAGSHTLGADQIAQLADDPDDFTRQLQVLGSAGGGAPGSAIITVDGFKNSSALPPKNSIASIRINPDTFSPEYEEPPFNGGRIEIFTKPGEDSFHGAVFFTDSDGSFNATDAFSTTATPAGKRRYGFELSGPIVRRKSDFSLALEKRDIDEFNVVNAITLGADDQPAALHQAVAAPQRLWIASARGDWQAAANDVLTLSYSANVSDLSNQGVGGLVLAEAGYNSLVSEYDLRLSNVQTVNANVLHETRIGYTWNDTAQAPLSTAPQLQVAGYFTGGGATSQQLHNRERDLEVDDELTIARGAQAWKFGVDSLGLFVHENDPDTFNGSYVFGGGNGPVLDASDGPMGATISIDGLEQYRRALNNLPGGTPTTYQLTSGTPLVTLTQWRVAFYARDTVKLAARLTMSAGLRYNFQSTPSSFANFAPRAGLSWSPDKKEAWVLHLHAGLFNRVRETALAVEVSRLDGVHQQERLIYSPNFFNPLTPASQTIEVGTTRVFPHRLSQDPSLETEVGVERDLPQHWHGELNYLYLGDWGAVRFRNINAPQVASSTGTTPDLTAALLAPRPIAPGENILQYQGSGHLAGHVLTVAVSQQKYKLFNLSAGYLYTNLRTDTGTGAIAPQSSYSNQGESARPDFQYSHQVYAFGTVNLPWKLTLSPQFSARSGAPYTAITGTDANGDGNFNDRPSYASIQNAGQGTGVYSTRFGLLTTNAVNGNVPRNVGTMPAEAQMDMELSRSWALGAQKPDSPRTLTLNVRSANMLNHANVTAVGTVVSSSTFAQSLSAEAARRVELGARFSF